MQELKTTASWNFNNAIPRDPYYEYEHEASWYKMKLFDFAVVFVTTVHFTAGLSELHHGRAWTCSHECNPNDVSVCKDRN